MRERGVDEPLHLLVIGGSLGARTLNEVVPRALGQLATSERPLVRHQCGESHLESCRALYSAVDVSAEVEAFIVDMPSAYGWADLVICRAGALTIAELAAAGVASILVPYPYAVDDHQFFNASFLSDAGAAERVREGDFSIDWLADKLRHLQGKRPLLAAMASTARAIAYTQATEQVANGVLEEARA